ncbi:hypothetical protein B0H12DRAFT_770166 [Mycena haematopus]|nr:hypothetical protein B0H12DRAFT_770166 [Mycena haematopus]
MTPSLTRHRHAVLRLRRSVISCSRSLAVVSLRARRFYRLPPCSAASLIPCFVCFPAVHLPARYPRRSRHLPLRSPLLPLHASFIPRLLHSRVPSVVPPSSRSLTVVRLLARRSQRSHRLSLRSPLPSFRASFNSSLPFGYPISPASIAVVRLRVERSHVPTVSLVVPRFLHLLRFLHCPRPSFHSFRLPALSFLALLTWSSSSAF